jgi:hypothetical protein
MTKTSERWMDIEADITVHLASFISDPPANDYQQGFLAALVELAKEHDIELPECLLALQMQRTSYGPLTRIADAVESIAGALAPLRL